MADDRPVDRFRLELAGENLWLAAAEATSVVTTLAGAIVSTDLERRPPSLDLVLASADAAYEVTHRVALARRLLHLLGEWEEGGAAAWASSIGATGVRAEFRSMPSRGKGGLGSVYDPIVGAFRRSGGVVDLTRPVRRFVLEDRPPDRVAAWEVLGEVDRAAFAARRMPRLPFRRPVSLDPRLARAAVNLARVRPGDRLIDPFVGTGALAAEAALVGVRISGVDRDPKMVAGALRNFAYLGVNAEQLVVGDAAESFAPSPGARWDAIVTDPPYGRASGAGGERTEHLLARVLPRWAELVKPSGRVVVVVPGGPDPLSPPWRRVVSVADRVHRSLTREFRVYARVDQ